jgi:hypothetical protein
MGAGQGQGRGAREVVPGGAEGVRALSAPPPRQPPEHRNAPSPPPRPTSSATASRNSGSSSSASSASASASGLSSYWAGGGGRMGGRGRVRRWTLHRALPRSAALKPSTQPKRGPRPPPPRRPLLTPVVGGRHADAEACTQQAKQRLAPARRAAGGLREGGMRESGEGRGRSQDVARKRSCAAVRVESTSRRAPPQQRPTHLGRRGRRRRGRRRRRRAPAARRRVGAAALGLHVHIVGLGPGGGWEWGQECAKAL